MSEKGMLYNIQRMSVHDGPGIRTTVFFKGCPLSCRWCSNPESQACRPQLLVFEDLCSGCGACEAACPHAAVTRNGERCNRDMKLCVNCGACAAVCPTNARAVQGREYAVNEVMNTARKDAGFYRNSDGGVTFGGGECTAQGEFLKALLQAARNEGFHTCVDTCGSCAPSLFAKLMPLTDLFLYDVKHMEPEAHKRLTGADNKIILDNLRQLLRLAPQKARIRMPLIPGVNDGDGNIKALAELLSAYGCTNIGLMPHHFFGRAKYQALKRPLPEFTEYSPEELRGVLERFANHGLAAALV